MEENREKQERTEEIIIEQRKEKIKNWFKNPQNLVLFIIISLAIIIRFYYFFMTINQPLWWDEAEYMSMAKKWALGTPFEFSWPRMPLLILLASIIFKLGFSEVGVKFFIEFISSVGVVVISYFLVKEAYDKKLALITSSMMAVFWLAIFNGLRTHTDVPLMFFIYLSIYFFWKGYIKSNSRKLMIFFGIFSALALLTKPTAGLLFVTYIIFLFLVQRLSFVKSKKLWIAMLVFLLLMTPYLIYAYKVFGNPLQFIKGSAVFSRPEEQLQKPIAWGVLSNFQWFTEWPFFIFFIIGLLVILAGIFLKLDLILKEKDPKKFPDLFFFLLIFVYTIYLIFFERYAEDRWLLPIALPIFIISARGVLSTFNLVKSYGGRKIAVVLLVIVLMLGGYYQIKHADSIIKIKKDSYMEVKEAALWAKENSNPDDVILSRSVTQVTFYSERKVYSFTHMNESGFFDLVSKTHPKYMIESVFEPNPAPWGLVPTPDMQKIMNPVKVWFADQEQTQAVLIIYKFVYQN